MVTSLSDLLHAVEADNTRSAAVEGLRFQLRSGLLECWLRDALGQAAAANSARQINNDERGLKVERWLQGVGLTTYLVGGQRISSVDDLAHFPERGGDLEALWEHIREGVPQERFKHDQVAIKILDEVRTSEIPPAHKPLVACLRLGLKRLPWSKIDGVDRFLTSFQDLERVMLEPRGREAVRALFESSVLEAWADAIAPGQGAIVAAARSLPSAIALDRAVRSVVGPGVYPVQGIVARNFGELVQSAERMLHVICGDAEARERIRDALLGPIRLPGTPSGLKVPTEAELSQLPRQHQANVFAWFALKLPILDLGGVSIRTIQEYLAAIATPAHRADAMRLARTGVVSLWYRRALEGSLSEPLQGEVPEQAFPALCIEMGELPASISVGWPTPVQKIADDAPARFQVELKNEDSTKTAMLELASTIKPQRGRVVLAQHVSLAPGASVSVPIVYQTEPGTSGKTSIFVDIAHAAPRAVAITTKQLLVTRGFIASGLFSLRNVAIALTVLVVGVIVGANHFSDQAKQDETRKQSAGTSEAVPAPPKPVRAVTKPSGPVKVLDDAQDTATVVAQLRPGAVVQIVVSGQHVAGWRRILLQSGHEGWVRENELAMDADSANAIALFDENVNGSGQELKAPRAGALFVDATFTQRLGGFSRGEKIQLIRVEGRSALVAVTDGELVDGPRKRTALGGRIIGYAKLTDVKPALVVKEMPQQAKTDAGLGLVDPYANDGAGNATAESAKKDEAMAALKDALDAYAVSNFEQAQTKAEQAVALGSGDDAAVIVAMAACKLGSLDKALRYSKRLRGQQLAQFLNACPAAQPTAKASEPKEQPPPESIDAGAP